MKCQEVLNSNDFKSENSEIIYNAERANLCEKCKTYEVILSTAKSLSDRKIFMKMFPCPFKQNNGSGQGLYFISLGSDSDTVFLYTDLQPYKLPLG